MSPICDAARRAGGRTLRGDVLRFLATQARPATWTWFVAARPAAGVAVPADRPDIVIEVGGRVVYVEIRAAGLGPLPAARRAWQAAARCSGAAIATVRSVPDLERLLTGLGVRLRRPGALASELATDGNGRKGNHGKIATRPDEAVAACRRRTGRAAHPGDRGPAAP